MTSTTTLSLEPDLEPPSCPPGPAPEDESCSRSDLIRHLGDRLITAQRPLRILEAIRWDESIERAFFAAGCRTLPVVDRDYYHGRPLPFDPAQKRRELLE